MGDVIVERESSVGRIVGNGFIPTARWGTEGVTRFNKELHHASSQEKADRSQETGQGSRR